MKTKIKLYNNVKNCFETIEVKKIDVFQLPYRLAYRKFLLKNGFSLNQSFYNSGKLGLLFDKMYNL